jgi:hypothetical protein
MLCGQDLDPFPDLPCFERMHELRDDFISPTTLAEDLMQVRSDNPWVVKFSGRFLLARVNLNDGTPLMCLKKYCGTAVDFFTEFEKVAVIVSLPHRNQVLVGLTSASGLVRHKRMIRIMARYNHAT